MPLEITRMSSTGASRFTMMRSRWASVYLSMDTAFCTPRYSRDIDVAEPLDECCDSRDIGQVVGDFAAKVEAKDAQPGAGERIGGGAPDAAPRR